MGELTQALTASARLVVRQAAEQGGVISGDNPTHYNESNPIRLWVIQLVIIIAMTQFLALIFGRIRQPRVIAEVIGGVLLGPTVMGRIPNFRDTIFPQDSMPLLNLTANIGLVLFLFLVGLEIDTRLIKRNVKAAATVSIAGLIIPLGLGAALGVGVYREFISPDVNFGYFLLFVAVAIGITAFPVLCRILTELKLLDTTVGVVVLSAGVGNDVVGWILLALTVALVNASSGLTALWVLLTCVGYVLFLLYPVRWGYVWMTKRTGSLEQGTPTTLMMTVTLLIVFISAFFTDIIGVHAIFGGFLAGLVVPHDNGFAIAIVEKIEDLVSILLLPLYFTLSGLRTDLGELNDGVAWGYVVIICLVAFFAKFLPCAIAAKMFGFNIRESGAIGSLMSCKGLVELIVLNIGLQADILEVKTFSMFVIHAIVLTFITTPLTLLFYPERYRVHEGHTTARDKPAQVSPETPRGSTSQDEIKTRFALVLDKIEQLSASMTLSRLLAFPAPSAPPAASVSDSVSDEKKLIPPPSPGFVAPMSFDILRLIELTNRTSAVFKSQEAESLIHSDPIVSIFRTFGYLNRFFVSAALSVVNYSDYASAISNHVKESDSQMLILPWSRGSSTIDSDPESVKAGVQNPFDGVFHKSAVDQTSSVVHSEFIRQVFLTCPTDVALFVDRGLNVHYSEKEDEQAVFLPFFGGPDDRLALQFLVQLCANPSVRATVVKIIKSENSLTPTSSKETEKEKEAPAHLTVAAADTVYGAHNTETRLASDTADNIIWDKFTGSSTAHTPAVTAALSRITFSVQQTTQPLHLVSKLVTENISRTGSKNHIVLTGRSRRLAVMSHAAELKEIMTEKGSAIGSLVPKTLGDVGASLVAAGTDTSLLVVQASVAGGA